jgi:hypothetical protein
MYWCKTRAEWCGQAELNKHCLNEIVDLVGENFMEFVSTFKKLGFQQVPNRSQIRNIWSYYIDGNHDPNANA